MSLHISSNNKKDIGVINTILLVSMVIVLLSGEQVTGLVSTSAVQVYSVLLSDGTTLGSISVLLLLTIEPSESVQFMDLMVVSFSEE